MFLTKRVVFDSVLSVLLVAILGWGLWTTNWTLVAMAMLFTIGIMVWAIWKYIDPTDLRERLVAAVLKNFVRDAHSWCVVTARGDEVDGWLKLLPIARQSFDSLVDAVRRWLPDIDTTDSARSYAAAQTFLTEAVSKMRLTKDEARNVLVSVMAFGVHECFDPVFLAKLEADLAAAVDSEFVDFLRRRRQRGQAGHKEDRSSLKTELVAQVEARFKSLQIAQPKILGGLIKALAKEAEKEEELQAALHQS